MNTYICPAEGCGREAAFVRFDSEEVLIPNGAALTRKPGPERVQRNFWVNCPVHKMRLLIAQGNHVSVKHPRVS